MHVPIDSLVWLLILAAATSAIAGRLPIPSTVALVVVGVIASSIGALENVHPTAQVILLLFLPPLLFEAAIHLDLPAMGRALPVALLLAVPGVVLSTVLIGVPLAALTPLSLWPAILFGALISATDPVSVVAIFRRLHAPPTLTAVLEGESLFNDGIALVLATLLLATARTGRFDAGAAVLAFLWAAGAGVALGALTGFVISEALRILNDQRIETTTSAALAYGSYLLANSIHASGPVAVVVAGMVFTSHGARQHLTNIEGRWIDRFWEQVGFLANALLFILIGLAIHLDQLWNHIGLVCIAVAITLISRIVVIYPLVLLVPRLGLTEAHILFWGGLRGGVAIAVALSLPAGLPGRLLIQTFTFGVVLFTILVEGTTIEWLARRLGILPTPGISTEARSTGA